ncbi:MAG: AmmeMemoRadiSam system radical SAM enzyme [Deltaproteobacteria bacterium]|nr:AmmeMemoRadiSam system radical SAM enzyme [Deltaproteobacteria bacterium]MBW2659036.1 AmmeMemoRadiSam system radical SAM enzyme [Deltaproteobacteria bacterium]
MKLVRQLENLHTCNGNDSVTCGICAHRCRLRNGQRGICGVHQNRDGKLVCLVYGRLVAEHVDPIEKKPLFHVLPGTLSYSISTLGCNFSCSHCQNASISQVDRREDVASSGVMKKPEEVVAAAVAAGCSSISYTYVEPTIFLEYAYDCCVLAAEKGIRNVFVSNGYMTGQVAELLAPFISAVNIDIKAFSDSFYKDVCGARLQPVLDSVKRLKELGVWLEATTLIIPGRNDSEEELGSIAAFLADIDTSIPWHVTGFYPAFKMTAAAPTSTAVLKRARQIGLDKGLDYVYAGNRPGAGDEDTFCPGCSRRIIKRYGFRVEELLLRQGCCPGCGEKIPGVWE